MILDTASCTVGEGQRVGVIGPNGAGKSTLLHAIVGLMPATAGAITVAGHRHHTVEAKRCFGWVADDLPMPDGLTGHEIAQLHQRLRGSDFDDQLCEHLLSIFALDEHRHRPCGDYSHGMRRKLSLTMALAHRPRLLILDEPFRGLDPVSSALLRQLIDAHATDDRAVLIATHDLEQASARCDRVVVIDGGRVVADGSPHELCAANGVGDLAAAFVSITGQGALVDDASRRLSAILRSTSASPTEVLR